jgi:hypothetical protein
LILVLFIHESSPKREELENIEFFIQRQLSTFMNLVEHIDLFKEKIVFSTIEIDSAKSTNSKEESGYFSRDQLIKHLEENACFTLSWLLTSNETISNSFFIQTETVLNEFDFKKDQFMTMDDYFQLFETNEKLKQLTETNSDMFYKYAASKSCKVRTSPIMLLKLIV